MDRTARGRHEFGLATDGRGPVATGVVRQASRVLAEGVEEFIFGDVFSQSTLSARERELLTVAVLAAIGGADNQLGVHVPAALRCGADPEEMIALCEQIAPYAGFPRALNALRAVRGVLEDRGLPLPVSRSCSAEPPRSCTWSWSPTSPTGPSSAASGRRWRRSGGPTPMDAAIASC